MAMSDRAKKCNLRFLVFDGGTKVCRALFEKLMKDLKPPDEDPETWTADKFLETKRTSIESKLSPEKKLILYPGAQRKTDIQKWDISILCLLLIETCKLSPKIRMYVEQIRKQRNKIAHLCDAVIDDYAYQCIFDKLKVCFENILLKVNDDGLKTTDTKMLIQLNNGSIHVQNDEQIRVEKANCHSSESITETAKYQSVEPRKVLQNGSPTQEATTIAYDGGKDVLNYKKNYVILVKDLQTMEISDHLFAKEVLTAAELMYIQYFAKYDKHAANRKMLKIIGKNTHKLQKSDMEEILTDCNLLYLLEKFYPKIRDQT